MLVIDLDGVRNSDAIILRLVSSVESLEDDIFAGVFAGNCLVSNAGVVSDICPSCR